MMLCEVARECSISFGPPERGNNNNKGYALSPFRSLSLIHHFSPFFFCVCGCGCAVQGHRPSGSQPRPKSHVITTHFPSLPSYIFIAHVRVLDPPLPMRSYFCSSLCRYYHH
uniref:Uncharacterized protein n=1 Tax=Trypanosoma vivax (strain Y486) TaxID=1055687 RepID=G0UD97_TRYVY|nr:hypothetical protein TVY486_1112920 [Trypanosoma vivax Y486]